MIVHTILSQQINWGVAYYRDQKCTLLWQVFVAEAVDQIVWKLVQLIEWCLFMSLTGFGADACLLSRDINFKNTY